MLPRELRVSGVAFDAPGRYVADHLAPAVLLVLGAVLLVRLTGWVARAYRARAEAEALRAVAGGGVVSELIKRRRAVSQAVEWTVAALVYTVAGILAVDSLGVPLASLVAPATVAGVAIGFGAQQVVADLLAGFFLFAERQFGVGDLVTLSLPGSLTGISGTVEELTLRVTRLRSQSGEVITVPNSTLRQVTNLSRDWSRVVVDLPVPVSSDLQAVIAEVRRVATDLSGEGPWRVLVLGEPTVAGVESIDADNVTLRVLIRTLPGRQFEVGRELRLRLAGALRGLGVAAPVGPVDEPGGGEAAGR